MFPIFLKPKCVDAVVLHDHFAKPSVDPVFQLYLHTKSNVKNVKYVEMVEFLVKELEVKCELDHIFSVFEWVMAV